MSTVPAETPEAAQAPAHTEAPAAAEAPASEWPVPACWSFLHPTVPYPTPAQAYMLKMELYEVRGNGVLGLLPDHRDDPEFFEFSRRLSVYTMQVLLVDAGYTADFRSMALRRPVTDKEAFHERLRALHGNRAFCAALDGAE
jgi:hypothetical protein